MNCDGSSAPMIVSSPDDTDPAIKALLIEGYRRMSPSQKLERVRVLTRAVQELALADIRRRHPNADEREQALRRHRAGSSRSSCSAHLRGMSGRPVIDAVRAATRRREARACFRRACLRYLVGGSLASSLYGIPRATQDVDLVADIRLSHVDAFTNALNDDFYVDANMIRDAIQQKASFNVVHLPTMFKADIFIPRDDEWSRAEMSRARDLEFDEPEGKVMFHFASAEDTLLHKLIWYKLGNQVSDRQWHDVLGVVKVQADLLDREYLEFWESSLEVSDLLAQALRQDSS
jgi:hypothetical protein